MFSTGISDAGASNVYVRLRVDGAWKVRAEFDSLLPVHCVGLQEVGEGVHVRVDAQPPESAPELRECVRRTTVVMNHQQRGH